ncbi:diacylglycerol/lipid kinase family protein [Deinococcus sp.]|uniref:diacylglycerol/lipid kinase family protein n=1 Tax=Deinococcus sp. TaxID=47478 RepID=UPI003CC616BC
MTNQTAPPKMRVLVIYNSKSGNGTNTVLQCAEVLQSLGCEVVLRELGEGASLAEQTADIADFDRLIAAGGDGTVSSVAYAVRYKNVPLLAYPAGTANLIALNLGMPDSPDALAEVLLQGHAVRVDLGELDVGGEQCGFAMLAGTGADAQMIRESEELKPRFGAMAYIMSALKQLNPHKTTFSMVVDGVPRSAEGIGVMVANFGKANYGLPISDAISPSDGRLTVIVLKAGNVFRLIPNLIDSLRSKLNLGDPVFGGNGSIETFDAREISIDAAEPFPLQYDGELHQQTTPFTARVLPGAIRFLTPVQKTELTT